MMRSRFILALALTLTPVVAAAEDAEGCKDSPILQRFPGAEINSCESKEFDEADLPGEVTAEKEVVNKHYEGKVEKWNYGIPENLSALQVMRNFENALRKAGARILVGASATDTHDYVTAVFEKKGKTIVNVAMNTGTGYDQTIVTPKELEQEVVADAGALMDEINRTGHVAVYGINFASGKATLTPDSDKVLGQVLELLRQNKDLKLRVEGHTDNIGKAKDNLALSKQRAASVKTWLTSKGIDGKRLTTDGFGDKKPVADNGSEEGRAKNRRVELVKL